MPNHDPERAFVAARVAHLDHRLDRAAEALAELDLYRDDLTGQLAEQYQAHRSRLAEIRAETEQYIKNLYGDGEPSPTQDVGQARAGVSAPGSTAPAGPGGSGPGRPINPHAAELEEAERLHDLTMAEYAAERQRHIRPGQGLL